MTINHVTSAEISPAKISSAEMHSSETLPEELTEQLLQFYLANNQSVLLPVPQLVEILTIPQMQVIPMFEMPAWVMGVYNWRGEVLWIVDLNHLVGLTPWYQQPGYSSKHTVIVLQQTFERSPLPNEPKTVLGLVVNRVDDLVTCPSRFIQPLLQPGEPNSTLQPFLKGFWQQSTDILHPILDGAAVFRAMPRS